MFHFHTSNKPSHTNSSATSRERIRILNNLQFLSLFVSFPNSEINFAL